MNKHLNQLIKHLIQLYLNNEENQIVFPKKVILIFRIQQSFLSLSYLYGKNMNSYIGLISMFARPQLFLPKNDAIQFIIFLFCMLYIINKVKPLCLNQQIKIFGQLLQSGILNFFFEYSSGIFQIITHTILVLISFTETIILQGTLNASTINFQSTRVSIYDFIILILNYVVMILYSYQFQNQLIKILALATIIVKIINQIQNSPLKDLETKSILMCIYFYTLLFGAIQLTSNQEGVNFEFIATPLIWKLTYMIYSKKFQMLFNCNNKKQHEMIKVLLYLHNIPELKNICIKKPQGARDKIIFCSLLMLQGYNYEAYSELLAIPKKDLNVLEQFKRQVIIRQCLNKIEKNIQLRQVIEQKISLAVSTLMISEQQNQAVLNDILEILKEKQLKQKLLLEPQTLFHFKHYFTLVEKILLLKNKLENYYSELASLKTQSILGFFYVEIINDYLAASVLYSVMQISDDKIKRINQHQEFFTSKMSFIISTLEQNLIIQKVSNDAPKVLKKSAEYLKDKQISILVPPGIAEIHDSFVLQFLKTGQAKYMRNLDLNFLFIESQNRMVDIEFAFDINFINDFTFIVFVQQVDRKSMAVILNQHNTITCLSEGLIQCLEAKFQITKYLGMNIKSIIQDFPQNVQHDQLIENAEISLQKNDNLLNCYEDANVNYITSYFVNCKSLNDQISYKIVYFEFFKKSSGYQQSITQFSPKKQSAQDYINTEGIKDINQESQIQIPYLEPSSKKIPFLILHKLNERSESIDKKCTTFNELQLLSNENNQNLLSPCGEVEMLIAENKLISKDSQLSNNIKEKKVERSKAEISIADEDQKEIQDQYSQEKIMIYQDDQSSQVSSLMGVRRSKYYKKYEIVQRILDQIIFGKKIRNYILLLVLCIVIQMILQIIQLVSINFNFISLISDIDLLQIKNFVFQPLETFLVTRYTIVNYSQQRDAKTITLAQFAELVKFPRSNLAIGYDQLDQNLKQLIFRPELQKFLSDNYLDIYIYTSSGVGEKYNMTLRNAIEILKNYQYTFKMAYIIDGVALADSPYSYYQYKNYLPLKKLFTQLNEQVLMESIQRSEKLMNQIIVIFCVSCSILLFFIIAVPYSYYQIVKKQFKFIALMQNVSEQFIEFDQLRYRYLIDKIEKDSNILCKYQFSLVEKEKILDINQEKVSKNIRQRQQTICCSQLDLNYHFAFIVCLLLIFGNSFVTFLEGQNYLAKYPSTAKFYKELSDVGTDVPTMYSQRDVLYGRANLKMYTPQDCQEILEEIKQAINRTAIFLDKGINFENYIATIDFEDYFSSIENSNLCDYVPDGIQPQASTICEIVMNQNLMRGLKVTLAYIINVITTDMEINQFTKKTTSNYLELEGAFIVSNIIQSANLVFNHDLAKQTESNNSSINIHNILILILLFFEIILILTLLKIKIKLKLDIVQRFIYILPVKTIFLDNYFERNIRHLCKVYK